MRRSVELAPCRRRFLLQLSYRGFCPTPLSNDSGQYVGTATNFEPPRSLTERFTLLAGPMVLLEDLHTNVSTVSQGEQVHSRGTVGKPGRGRCSVKSHFAPYHDRSSASNHGGFSVHDNTAVCSSWIAILVPSSFGGSEISLLPYSDVVATDGGTVY